MADDERDACGFTLHVIYVLDTVFGFVSVLGVKSRLVCNAVVSRDIHMILLSCLWLGCISIHFIISHSFPA
jgi:hypothetical protein